MDQKFKDIVVNNLNFSDVTLEAFSALTENEINIYFTENELPFKAKVLKLRNYFNKIKNNTGIRPSISEEFLALVSSYTAFKDILLDDFCALSETDISGLFDTTTIAGTTFKGKVMALRHYYNFHEFHGKLSFVFGIPNTTSLF